MATAAAPYAPRFEHRTETGPVLGIGTGTPRLSWSVPTADEGYSQTAYELEVTRGGHTQVYRIESAEQVLVPWPAPALSSRESASVRVRVAHDVDWGPWSKRSVVEAGLLTTSDWVADFISPIDLGAEDMPAPILTGTIDVPGEIAKARLYATAHGIYVATLNGQRIDDSVLAPGWTSYENRLRYHTYDVTSLVRQGANTLDMLLGNGWYRGRLGFENKRALYGDRLAVLAQLEVTTVDGGTYVLLSDGSWTARESNIVSDDLYDGQRTDLRITNDLVAQRAGPDKAVKAFFPRFVAREGPAIRPTDVISAQSV